MANVLTSYIVAGIANNSGAGGTAYTVSANVATAIGFSIANNSTTAVISVQVTITRGATTVNWVPPGANIPVGASFQAVGQEGKIVLKNGDVVKVIPTGGTVDIIMSVLEQ